MTVLAALMLIIALTVSQHLFQALFLYFFSLHSILML